MKTVKKDALIIGGGAAGLAAAHGLHKLGHSAALVDREHMLGGILNQCIHNGFGLHHFKEELTGPEYASRYVDLVYGSSADLYPGMTVTQIEPSGKEHRIYGFSAKEGMICFQVGAVILAMGCRERNRGNIGTPGTRPSGVFTAGLAQRLVNIEGYIPGKECVIVGSGDIGLIMARRMTWVGAHVKAVIEIQPYPAGLTRNIVQCLHDFNIPLYLNHVVSEIYGKDRVEGVEVRAQDGSRDPFRISCDTVLLSVGLIPDNELSKACGIEINPETGGPYVDSRLMTSISGIFACGNVLHVHDLVDYVSQESLACAEGVSSYLKQGEISLPIKVSSKGNLRYVVPNQVGAQKDQVFYMRSLIVGNKATLTARAGGHLIKTKSFAHVQPSEMIQIVLRERDLALVPKGASLEFSLKVEKDE